MINVAGIIAGGLIGLLGSRVISDRYRQTLMQANGVCVLFVGIAGVMQEMMKVSGNALVSSGTMMIVISFALGALIGEWINLEQRMEQFGSWLRVKTGNSGENRFVDGFVTCSLTICVGAMAVVGSIQDGIQGDPSTLIASSEKAKEILGWKPQFDDLETIITTAWNWHKNHPNGYEA